MKNYYLDINQYDLILLLMKLKDYMVLNNNKFNIYVTCVT